MERYETKDASRYVGIDTNNCGALGVVAVSEKDGVKGV
jgi:hypothetical protein